MKPLSISVWRWLLFNVTISISPLILTYALRALFSQNPSLIGVLEHGELFIVATGLAATAIGHVVSRWKHSQLELGMSMVAVFISVIIVLFSIACFSSLQLFGLLEPKLALLAQAMQNAQPPQPQAANMILSLNKNLLFHSSWIAFVFAVITGIYANWEGTDPTTQGVPKPTQSAPQPD
jgi:hypothetical protein